MLLQEYDFFCLKLLTISVFSLNKFKSFFIMKNKNFFRLTKVTYMFEMNSNSSFNHSLKLFNSSVQQALKHEIIMQQIDNTLYETQMLFVFLLGNSFRSNHINYRSYFEKNCRKYPKKNHQNFLNDILYH